MRNVLPEGGLLGRLDGAARSPCDRGDATGLPVADYRQSRQAHLSGCAIVIGLPGRSTSGQWIPADGGVADRHWPVVAQCVPADVIPLAAALSDVDGHVPWPARQAPAGGLH